jgi:hypothetical protein
MYVFYLGRTHEILIIQFATSIGLGKHRNTHRAPIVFYRAGWCSGNARHLYSECAQFESRPWHWLCWGLSWSSSVLPGKFRDRTSIRPRPLPSESFPIHYQSSTIRRYIISILNASLNNTRKKTCLIFLKRHILRCKSISYFEYKHLHIILIFL